MNAPGTPPCNMTASTLSAAIAGSSASRSSAIAPVKTPSGGLAKVTVRMPSSRLWRTAVMASGFLSGANYVSRVSLLSSHTMKASGINDRWRLCFRFVDGDAWDAEIVDYH